VPEAPYGPVNRPFGSPDTYLIGAGPVIGFPKVLQQLISEHLSNYGEGPEGLILQNCSGKIWRYKDAAAMFREVLTSLGIHIDGEGLHNLRHTFVSNAIRRAVSAKRIQVWVGHKSITETMDTYGHLFPDDFDEMTNMIDMGSWEDLEPSDEEAKMWGATVGKACGWPQEIRKFKD